MVVPFFGDQQFWGTMIGESGAGAHPVPFKKLTAEKLAEGIRQCLTEESRQGAEKIAKKIEKEGDGAKNAVAAFHRSLALKGQKSMRCAILEDRVAVWKLKKTSLRLSALAAELLVDKKRVSWKQLRLIRHTEWNDFEGPGEPLTGGATAVIGAATDIASGVGSVPFRLAKSSKRRAKHEEKKKRLTRFKGGHSIRLKRASSGASRTSKGNNVPKEDHSLVNTAGSERNAPGSSRPRTESESDQPGADRATEPQEKHPFNVLGKPCMDKHTATGEPAGQAEAAIKESKSKTADGEKSKDGDQTSVLSDDPEDSAAHEVANDVGEGVGKAAEALARAPMDLALAISQGFHNAPRLYGDTTVRK